ncbi:MAG: Cohesin protein [Candidatus Hydrogenedentes bacterium]|nr:Cohesin protein [Candidatus Hydrogenedentota bacterium]
MRSKLKKRSAANGASVRAEIDTKTLWVFIVLTLLCAMPTGAGTLQIGTPTVEEQRVTFPVRLEGDVGDGVAAMDFRFNYDASQYKPLSVAAGQAALSADKRVEWNVRNPGECVIVMMGMNQNMCRPGDVAQIVFQRLDGAGGAESEFAVTRPTLSTLDGEGIAVEGSVQRVRFTPDNTVEPVEPDDDTENGGQGTRPGDTDTPETPETPAGTETDAKAQDDMPLQPSVILDGLPAGGSALAGSRTASTARSNVSPDGTAAERIDRERLAEADRMRGTLPTPGTAASSVPDAAKTEGAASAAVPNETKDSTPAEPGTPMAQTRSEDTSGTDVPTVENDKTTRVDAGIADPGVQNPPQKTAQEPPFAKRLALPGVLVAGVGLVVLILARRRFFT